MSSSRPASPSTKTHRREVLRSVVAFAALALAGCVHRAARQGPRMPTKVSRGEKVEIGSPVYDEYFDTVHDLHVLVTTTRLEERDARSSLASVLGLLPTAPQEQVLEKLRERVQQLPSMHLHVDDKVKPPSSRIVVTPGSSVDESTKGLNTVIEASANAELSIYQRMSELPERAHRVHNVGDTLIDSAQKDFASRPPSEREQVDAELHDAQELLVRIAQDAQDIAAEAHGFVVKLQEAVERSGTSEPASSRNKKRGAKPSKPRRQEPADFNP
jgi:hypothetical protein